MGDADSLSASDPPAKKTTQHRASFIPSSGNLYGKAPHPNGAKNNPLATQSTVPSNINPFRNVLSSSDHSGDSSVVKSTSPMPPSDNIPKECKRQRLEVSTGHPLHKNIPANEKVATTLFPSSNTLKSNTLKRDTPPPQRGVPPICAFTRNKSFSAPAASIDSHPPAAPQRHSANSAPTPHAPGAFLQPRSKVPGLSATSHAFNDTPTPAPRNRLGRLTSRGRTLVVPKSFPPSSPTVACRGMATGVSQSGLAPATNRLADQQCSEGEAERRRNPQDGLDAYTSSDLPPRKQPIRVRQYRCCLARSLVMLSCRETARGGYYLMRVRVRMWILIWTGETLCWIDPLVVSDYVVSPSNSPVQLFKWLSRVVAHLSNRPVCLPCPPSLRRSISLVHVFHV